MTFPFGGPIYDSAASLPAATEALYNLQYIIYVMAVRARDRYRLPRIRIRTRRT